MSTLVQGHVVNFHATASQGSAVASSFELSSDTAGGFSGMITKSSRVQHEQRVLRWCLLAFAVLVVLKFFVILADVGWDLTQSPYGLLVVVLVPALLLAWLLDRRPRLASILFAAAMLLWMLTVVSALARDGFAREAWADYPFAYGGLAVALLGIYSSVRLWNFSRREVGDQPRSARAT